MIDKLIDEAGDEILNSHTTEWEITKMHKTVEPMTKLLKFF